MILPTFTTERLLLKPMELKYLDAYEKNFVDYEVIRHLSAAVPWPYPAGGVKAFLENSMLPRQGKDRWSWGIFTRENPEEAIGCVDLWREGKPEHRGFWLARKHWGKGFMSEAVGPVTEYAFTVLGFESLIFSNALGNIGSRRVKEKAGAKFLRVEPAQFVDPKYTEHEIWELSKKAWEERQKPLPSLQTKRLILRPLTLTDAKDVQRLAGDPAIAAMTLNVPHPYKDGLAEAWIATHARNWLERKSLTLGVFSQQNGTLVGCIGMVFQWPHERAEIGYWVGKPFWSQGYCSEAAAELLRYAFAELGLKKITAHYLAKNPASGRVMEKIGMQREGYFQNHIKKDGVLEDMILCSKLRI